MTQPFRTTRSFSPGVRITRCCRQLLRDKRRTMAKAKGRSLSWKILFILRRPRGLRFTNNYGNWCVYSTNPALLGSFIFGFRAKDKILPLYRRLPPSFVAPLAAVRRLDQKRVFLDFEETVAVGRSSRDPAELITRIDV